MNKKLKKLSRVELLELLVSLSEDYEELVDENNKLKKMLAAQRLPRTAKVGSIADAALQANRFFESAQRSADDYLREIKHLRDELAKRVEAQRQTAQRPLHAPQSRDQLELRQAQERAGRIIAQANAQAEAIIATARSRADMILADANRQIHIDNYQAQRRAATASHASADVRQGSASASATAPAAFPQPSYGGSASYAMSAGPFAPQGEGLRRASHQGR